MLWTVGVKAGVVLKSKSSEGCDWRVGKAEECKGAIVMDCAPAGPQQGQGRPRLVCEDCVRRAPARAGAARAPEEPGSRGRGVPRACWVINKQRRGTTARRRKDLISNAARRGN